MIERPTPSDEIYHQVQGEVRSQLDLMVIDPISDLRPVWMGNVEPPFRDLIENRVMPDDCAMPQEGE